MRLFKIRAARRGAHVHCRVFVTLTSQGPQTGVVPASRIAAHPHLRARDYLATREPTWANIGTLTMSEDDWTAFQQQLNDPTKRLFEVEPDE